ncbi:MAG: substrate-binding domain-containing protein [Lachnospiraceae bacterium]
MKKSLIAIATVFVLTVSMIFGGCGTKTENGKTQTTGKADMKVNVKGETLRILSGSENQELTDVIEQCEKETGVKIEMTYKGSVDIMHELEAGAESYDAVWPASSLWISLGDKKHLVKENESISTSPVVFGIRESIAKNLHLTDRKISVKEILKDIEQKKLTFCMTSATQSNSGTSAYIGFLYALLGKSEGLTEEDLDKADLKEKISSLLSGIDRSSGSSDWLKEMFLSGDFDAMVNYESLIIDANEQLTAQGKEPLYVVYPYDGLSLADSPLGYVDHGEKKKQEAFRVVQDYLLSKEVQSEIEKTGRRTELTGVSKENESVFKQEWGIDTKRILSPITMPSEKVLKKALDLYQTNFRKPSLNVYCLDYSGSMEGEGNQQLVEAMGQILVQKNAEKNLLQASEGEVNIIITFNSDVMDISVAKSAEDAELESLYEGFKQEQPIGGTDMYLALQKGLELIADSYDVSNYTPALILMTDGESDEMNKKAFEQLYKERKLDIPVFSIMFGEADSTQLEELAKLTNARVFDGREDLVTAFRSVKGYN